MTEEGQIGLEVYRGFTGSRVYFRYLFFRHLGSALLFITGHLETAQYNQWTHQLVDVSVSHRGKNPAHTFGSV